MSARKDVILRGALIAPILIGFATACGDRDQASPTPTATLRPDATLFPPPPIRPRGNDSQLPRTEAKALERTKQGKAVLIYRLIHNGARIDEFGLLLIRTDQPKNFEAIFLTGEETPTSFTYAIITDTCKGSYSLSAYIDSGGKRRLIPYSIDGQNPFSFDQTACKLTVNQP